ncbi:MAG: hypothetical protein K2J55_02155, partial [Eubacterium sp.]|nr:hypothetical protein [Eubacterium sp.]
PYIIKRAMPIKNKIIAKMIIVIIMLTSFGCLSLSKNKGRKIILPTIKVIKGARKPSQKLSFFQIKTPDIPRIMLNIKTPNSNRDGFSFLTEGYFKIGK